MTNIPIVIFAKKNLMQVNRCLEQLIIIVHHERASVQQKRKNDKNDKIVVRQIIFTHEECDFLENLDINRVTLC